MSNLEWMSWVDWKHLLEMLVLPSLILIASLTAGILLNRMINKRLTVPTTETGWQFVFINALRGVPISLCLVTGLYWIVNTINIIEPLVRIFSYILFTVIILSLTRVLARTVSGIINLQIERNDFFLHIDLQLGFCYGIVDAVVNIKCRFVLYSHAVSPHICLICNDERRRYHVLCSACRFIMIADR